MDDFEKTIITYFELTLEDPVCKKCWTKFVNTLEITI